MIDDFSLQFGKVQIWGWPWHGLISRVDEFSPSLLQLPNSTTRPHDMPEQPWYTYRIKVPGVAAISRTPEQVAADLALGMEWRNEAILSGRFYQVYSKDLGGWIYCAADGSRWIINRAAATARRLGEIGKPEDVRSITINMPMDNGQSSPTIEIAGSVPVLKLAEMPTDITPDGRDAILMYYFDDPDYDIGERPVPVGFLLASLTGGIAEAFVLDVSVLHTRTETLGTTSYTDAMTVTEDGFGNPNSATGQEDRGFTGRIWSAWFDDAGDPQACTVDKQTEFEQEYPITGTSGYNRLRILWQLKVAGVQVAEVDLESVFTSDQTGTIDAGGTLNGVSIYSAAIPGFMAALPKAGPYDLLYQVMPRNLLESVNAGDQFDVLPFSNNLIAFYVRLSATGSANPEHHYIGSATPAGAVALSEIENAAAVSAPQRNALFGPLPYGAFNPVTHEIAAPVALPVSWT